MGPALGRAVAWPAVAAPRRAPQTAASRGGAERALGDLRAGVSRMADALFRLDTAPELALVRDGSAMVGQSAVLAGEATARLRSAWELYPVLTSAVDALEEAVAGRREAEAERLLGPSGVALPDGTSTSPVALLASLEDDLEAAQESAGRLAAAWRDTVPRLDRASATLAMVEARASDLGVGGPDVVQARSLLSDLVRQSAADPLGIDPGPAERAVERARARVESLVEQRASLPADLEGARRMLAEISGAIDAGRHALAATRSRIAGPSGTLEPLDPALLDAGPSALRPWLGRLEAAAAAGNWVTAAPGLDQWQQEADRLLHRARAVLAANQAPLAHRNDLRGLLDGFRAKAGAVGRAESPTLTALYRAGRDALYTVPCHLDTAEARVRDFVAAVNTPEPDPGPGPPGPPGPELDDRGLR